MDEKSNNCLSGRGDGSEGKSTLVALRDRLAKATGPSRVIDAAIENWLAGGTAADLGYILTDIETTTKPPAYTASIDAAVTLVPSEFRNFWSCGDESETAKLFARYGYGIEQTATTVPLALCVARVEYEIAKLDEAGKQGRSAAEQPPNGADQ